LLHGQTAHQFKGPGRAMFDFNAVMQNTVNRQGFGDGEAPPPSNSWRMASQTLPCAGSNR
jgi:hypothetical protein